MHQILVILSNPDASTTAVKPHKVNVVKPHKVNV